MNWYISLAFFKPIFHVYFLTILCSELVKISWEVRYKLRIIRYYQEVFETFRFCINNVQNQPRIIFFSYAIKICSLIYLIAISSLKHEKNHRYLLRNHLVQYFCGISWSFFIDWWCPKLDWFLIELVNQDLRSLFRWALYLLFTFLVIRKLFLSCRKLFRSFAITLCKNRISYPC